MNDYITSIVNMLPLKNNDENMKNEQKRKWDDSPKSELAPNSKQLLLEINNDGTKSERQRKLESFLSNTNDESPFLRDEIMNTIEHHIIPRLSQFDMMKDTLLNDVGMLEWAIKVEKLLRRLDNIEIPDEQAKLFDFDQRLDRVDQQCMKLEELEAEFSEYQSNVDIERRKQKEKEIIHKRNELVKDASIMKEEIIFYNSLALSTFDEQYNNLGAEIEKLKSGGDLDVNILDMVEEKLSSILEEFKNHNETKLIGNFILDADNMVYDTIVKMGLMENALETFCKSILSLHTYIRDNISKIEWKYSFLKDKRVQMEKEMKNIKSIEEKYQRVTKQVKRQEIYKTVDELMDNIQKLDDEKNQMKKEVQEKERYLSENGNLLISSDRDEEEIKISDIQKQIKELELEEEDFLEEIETLIDDNDGDCTYSRYISFTEDRISNKIANSNGSRSSNSLIRIPLSIKVKPKRCEILERIGKGGFANVFRMKMKTRKRNEDHIVAFKQFGIVRDSINPSEARMIEKEIELLSHLQQENIVKIIGVIDDPDAKDTNGTLLGIGIIMEYCENGSVRAILNKADNALDMNLIVHILFGAAKGLEYLHNHEPNPVIHGDVKGDNILVDEDFNVKLCDFGISRLMQTTKASTKLDINVGGTIAYKPPEVFYGQVISDAKTDVYSFGCLMIEMLTGERPWQGLKDEDIKIKVMNKELAYNREKIRADAQEDIVYLMKRCLDYDKVKRPTMRQIRRELEKLMKYVALVNLSKGSEEYNRVESLFFPGGDKEGTLTKDKFRIVNIEKVMSRFAESLYKPELYKIQAILSKSSTDAHMHSSTSSLSSISTADDTFTIERFLFHGTSQTDPMLILNHPDAFMKDYSNIGYYGRGLYFAELARYSNSLWIDKNTGNPKSYRYTIPNSNQYQVLVCSVICGNSYEFGSEVSEKTRSLTQRALEGKYHSVHAGPHRPNGEGPGNDDSCMYVIYKDTQVVARYLITYEDAG